MKHIKFLSYYQSVFIKILPYHLKFPHLPNERSFETKRVIGPLHIGEKYITKPSKKTHHLIYFLKYVNWISFS